MTPSISAPGVTNAIYETELLHTFVFIHKRSHIFNVNWNNAYIKNNVAYATELKSTRCC